MLPRPPSSTLFPYTTLFRSASYRSDETGCTHKRAVLLRCGVKDWLDSQQRACLVICGEIDEAVRSLLHVANALRSEEHTSELQSHSDLVCRLLLEKKKEHTPCAASSAGSSRAADPRASVQPR